MFDPAENKTMPQKMIDVLNAFNIPEEEWQAVLLTALGREHHKIDREEQFRALEPKVLDLPDYFYALNDDKASQLADLYLESRGVNRNQYPFYLAYKSTDREAQRWFGRLIIPVYKDNKLIFYQGRDMTGKRRLKYLSPDVPRDNILFGYNQLHQNEDQPLYIVEGWFDAFIIDGIAVFGNQLTSNQINWLRQSRREKVVIPDRMGEGYLLAEQAIHLGWSVSTPDIGQCKDVNDAFVKYGKLYTYRAIRENTASGFEALTRTRLYCEQGNDLSRSKGKNSQTSQQGRS